MEAMKFIGMAFGAGFVGSIAGRLSRDIRQKIVQQSKLLKSGQIKMEQFRSFVKKLLTKKIGEEFTGNIGGETDITNADNLQVNEDEFTANLKPEHNIVAKTFDTKADFDSYVNQRRGIEMTSKEIQSIVGYQKAKPTQQDKFFAKYEKTDDFGNNSTTIIKKLREGNQFCWTAFSKNETADNEGKPDEEKHEMHESESPIASSQSNPSTSQNQSKPSLHSRHKNEPQQDDSEVTVNDSIRITKTITFTDDSTGSQILGDFLQKLDL
jgi:hypothetical protein